MAVAYLIEDVHGSGLEQQHGQDEAQRQERSLATRQLGKALLPHAVERDADFQPVEHRAALRRLQLGGGAGQQGGEDGRKVAAHLVTGGDQHLVLRLVQLLDDSLWIGSAAQAGRELVAIATTCTWQRTSILDLSFSMMRFFFMSSVYSFSAVSIMPTTFLFSVFASLLSLASSLFMRRTACSLSRASKS